MWKIRNGGYYVAGSQIGLDVVEIAAYLEDQDRRYEQFKRDNPLPADMIERFEQGKRELPGSLDGVVGRGGCSS